MKNTNMSTIRDIKKLEEELQGFARYLDTQINTKVFTQNTESKNHLKTATNKNYLKKQE